MSWAARINTDPNMGLLASLFPAAAAAESPAEIVATWAEKGVTKGVTKWGVTEGVTGGGVTKGVTGGGVTRGVTRGVELDILKTYYTIFISL